MRLVARAAIDTWRRLRFRAWVAHVRLQLRRFGASLVLDAPHGAVLEGAPRVRVFPDGSGGATFTLRLGEDIRIGRGLTIELFAGGDNLLEIGDHGRILDGVRIALRDGAVRFGAFCLIRDGVWLKSGGTLSTADGVTLSSYTAVHCTEAIELDELVGIGERVSIIDSDHTFDGSDIHYMRKPLTSTPVRIRRNSMVAFGSAVLRGATIGANSVVAANSVVRAGDYPAGSFLAGNPAKAIKQLSDERGAAY